ncbi:MAG: flagellar motor protein MotB [Alphaproteobacteria bacterium]
MALEDQDGDSREVIVKRIAIPADSSHGGAWKVAYADFVTAMMAFFLLLWLLNATTEDQKEGISNYFEPVGAIKGSTGSGGMFGGISATDPGPIDRPGQTVAAQASARPAEAQDASINEKTGEPTPVREVEEDGSEKERQDAAFQAAQAAMEQALKQIPELQDLRDSVIIEITEDGLRIVLMDQEKKPMFETGSGRLNDAGRRLMQLVADVAQRLPNKVSITGHTSLAGVEIPRRGSDWALSLDRANAARRFLVENGISERRIETVDGKADTELLVPQEAAAPRNRRIEIVLLRPKAAKDAAVPAPRIIGR